MEVDAPVPRGRCGRSAEQSTGSTPSSRKMIGTPAVRPLSVRCSRGSHQRRGVVRVDAVQQEATARARELQRSWYGEPLGALFRRLIDDLGLNQARLAAVLGLSAPMLSQLMSGQRAKIGNPAVVQRVQALQDLAGQVADGSVSAGRPPTGWTRSRRPRGIRPQQQRPDHHQLRRTDGQAGRPRDPVAAALGVRGRGHHRRGEHPRRQPSGTGRVPPGVRRGPHRRRGRPLRGPPELTRTRADNG